MKQQIGTRLTLDELREIDLIVKTLKSNRSILLRYIVKIFLQQFDLNDKAQVVQLGTNLSMLGGKNL